MMMLVTITEPLLYISYALVIGGLFLASLPEQKKPPLSIPNWLLPTSIISICLFGLGPVIQVWSFIPTVTKNSISIWSFLTENTQGQAWLATTFGVILLLLFLWMNDIHTSRPTAFLSLVWGMYLLLSNTWASHGASLATLGLWATFFHFLAVSIWFGILLYIAWFGSTSERWGSFLKWYTPTSIACIITIFLAGLILMQYIAPEYWNSWLLPYGEALLIKHLLFAVILSFAIVNAFWLRKKGSLSWLRAETIIVVLILIVTGWMGQQEPPHEVLTTLQYVPVSPLFETVTTQDWNPLKEVTLSWTSSSILLAVMSLGFFLLMIVWVYQKRSAWLYLLLGVLWVCTSFLAILFSITPR
ncbi:copper resistance D family protein [Risungbinella massiliensis]|uniref:copper resistance D family protein n=1 Tax=Risungbinella massiliensis TaxID=1329796 RepID=UPI0005CC69F6|nr:hypothetical protein [Risungbinella massiliensis]